MTDKPKVFYKTKKSKNKVLKLRKDKKNSALKRADKIAKSISTKKIL